jgi:hypothetical protein
MSSIVTDRIVRSIIKQCHHCITLLVWNRYIMLYSDKPAVIATFKRIYCHFVVSRAPRVDLACSIICGMSRSGRPELIVDNTLYELPKTDHYIGHAELIIFRCLLEHIDDYIVLHAGVVTRNNRAYVLYGQSGFGKTTLTLELVRRGYGFMSDEFCPMRLSDFLIEPFERLIGLKNTSPFYRLVQFTSAVSCRFEGKDFFDCTELFSHGARQPCTAAAFIEISGTIDTDICLPGGVVLDIYMCPGNHGIPSGIEQLPGVTVTGPLVCGYYEVYRVTATDRALFVKRFNSIWRNNSQDIFAVFPYRGAVDSYDREPVLSPVPTFEGVTSVFSNIVNRSPDSLLLAACEGKTAPLVMKLAGLLKNIPCFRLQPGRLAKMADLIDTIS